MLPNQHSEEESSKGKVDAGDHPEEHLREAPESFNSTSFKLQILKENRSKTSGSTSLLYINPNSCTMYLRRRHVLRHASRSIHNSRHHASPSTSMGSRVAPVWEICFFEEGEWYQFRFITMGKSKPWHLLSCAQASNFSMGAGGCEHNAGQALPHIGHACGPARENISIISRCLGSSNKRL